MSGNIDSVCLKLFAHNVLCWSWSVVIGVVTTLRRDRGITVRFLKGAKDLSPLPLSQSGAAAQKPPIQLGTGNTLPGLRWPHCQSDESPASDSPYAFMACTKGDKSTFTFIYSNNV